MSAEREPEAVRCAGMTPRDGEIAGFLAAGEWRAAARRPFASDASFRRYYRLEGGPKPALLMDAPPPHEDVRPWCRIARHLVGLGLSAPAIYQADEERGLLVIEDFGDATLPSMLEAATDPRPFYAAAVDTLVALQQAPGAARIEVPRYDEPQLIEKAMLLVDWFLPAVGRALGTDARAAYEEAWRAALPLRAGVPETLALRDYFPENIMWLPARPGIARCGLLDFQDAMLAPAVYDLVSLVEDARRDVPDAIRTAMLARYLATFPGQDRAAFEAAAAVMAAQRHARVIGVFTRLWKRDGKPVYLAHIPRVWRMLERALLHPGLAPLKRWFDEHVPAALRRVPAPAEAAEAPAGLATASGETITRGMVLAAGLGLRMRPITESKPKPLVAVAGRTLLDRALDHFAAAGLARVVVNTHYLAEQIEAHVKSRARPEIVLSHESALLETGGGVLKALPELGAAPFVVANSDAFWLDGPLPALTRLARAWNGAVMDALLLVAMIPGTLGYEGRGDFFMDGLGRLTRRRERDVAPFLFTGVQILHPRLFEGEAHGKFSLNRVYDKALKAGRLWGLRHDGAWYHVGDPDGLIAVEARLKAIGAAAA